jgi:hypothetical protein
MRSSSRLLYLINICRRHSTSKNFFLTIVCVVCACCEQVGAGTMCRPKLDLYTTPFTLYSVNWTIFENLY